MNIKFLLEYLDEIMRVTTNLTFLMIISNINSRKMIKIDSWNFQDSSKLVM